MAVEAIATAPSGLNGATAQLKEGIDTANAPSAVREPSIEVVAHPDRAGESLGNRLLNGLEKLQDKDTSLRARTDSRPRSVGAVNEPGVKVATRLPGPAEASFTPVKLEASNTAGHRSVEPGEGQNDSNDRLLDRFQEVADHSIQVQLLSSTSSSATGALNKLISSN